MPSGGLNGRRNQLIFLGMFSSWHVTKVKFFIVSTHTRLEGCQFILTNKVTGLGFAFS